MTNWNPTYYADVLGLSPAASSTHLAMPHVTNLAIKTLNPAMVGPPHPIPRHWRAHPTPVHTPAPPYAPPPPHAPQPHPTRCHPTHHTSPQPNPPNSVPPHAPYLATRLSPLPDQVSAVQRRGYSLLTSRRIFTCVGFVSAGG